MIPTAIYTATGSREPISNQEHADELAYWSARMKEPDFYAELANEIIRQLAFRAVRIEAKLHVVELMAERAKRQREATRPPAPPPRPTLATPK
jgi:hypothetical protein